MYAVEHRFIRTINQFTTVFMCSECAFLRDEQWTGRRYTAENVFFSYRFIPQASSSVFFRVDEQKAIIKTGKHY